MQIATSDDRRANDPAFQGYLLLRTGGRTVVSEIRGKPRDTRRKP